MTLPPPHEKERAVQAMFTSIAQRYDLNNTLLSFGLHHVWKRRAIRMSGAAEGETVLDVCTGTGDLAILLARQVGPTGQVVGLDLNEGMLAVGRKKLARLRLPNVTLLAGNAETLQFCDRTFHAATVAFGIRNVTRVEAALAELFRVLKPGGTAVCLEFSRPPTAAMRRLYDLYSYRLLPRLGTAVSHDATGVYTYLPDSIRAFPDQEKLAAMFRVAGFQDVRYRNLSGGIVAIHTGTRPVA